MLSKYVLYYGKDAPPRERRELRAGPLSLIFEPDIAFLRYVRLGDQEFLRGIYSAVRDHNWGTVDPQVSNVQLEQYDRSFRLTFDVDCVDPTLGIDFYWKGTITGDTEGIVTYTMEGLARSSFRRNRIGFCILHPPSAAGEPARIEHVDGTIEESTFPTTIAPQRIIDGTVKPVSPFEEMRALSYRVGPDLWLTTHFEGDIFEMEDQRNWTDASFKTYCTPLRLPFPVEVEEGTEIMQSVTLTLEGEIPQRSDEEQEKPLTFSIASEGEKQLPRIGLGTAGHGQSLSEQELERLRTLHLSHLRVDLTLSERDYAETLRRVTNEARAIGVPLEVAVHLSDDAAEELQALRNLLDQVRPDVQTWLVFHVDELSASQRWIELAREHLADYDQDAVFGAGTDAFFTELNRGRPSNDTLKLLDVVCYSLNPQVHAFDNGSMVETLATQATTVESTRTFAGDASVAVTPVTLKMRFNPNATGPEPEPAPGELPSQVDVRQMSLFGAGWTVGSLKYLAESGVYSATYYETTGWRGVMETEDGSRLPEKFRSLPGGVFPMYHVFADVGDFAGGQIVSTESSDTLTVDGLALRQDGQMRVILANMTVDPQQVTVENLGEAVRIRRLNETNAVDAMEAPAAFREERGEERDTPDGALTLELAPYEIIRLDT